MVCQIVKGPFISTGWRIAFIVHFIFTFLCCCLHTVVWFQVFLSNTNNYMVSSNYFYLMIVICLHAVMWFQVINDNP